jgi:hypothetical protein
MRSTMRPRSMRMSDEAAEVLEMRAPVSATAIAALTAMEIVHSNSPIPSHLAAIPDLIVSTAGPGPTTASGMDSINANPTWKSEIIESTKSGKPVGETSIDAAQDGAIGVAGDVKAIDVFFVTIGQSANS